MMGRVVPERGDESLREVIFRGYRIIYKVRADVVGIICFAHGARDIRRVLDARGRQSDQPYRPDHPQP